MEPRYKVTGLKQALIVLRAMTKPCFAFGSLNGSMPKTSADKARTRWVSNKFGGFKVESGDEKQPATFGMSLMVSPPDVSPGIDRTLPIDSEASSIAELSHNLKL